MNHVDSLASFTNQLADARTLTPRIAQGKKISKATFSRRIVTVVGVKTTTGRFLPVSHAGYSNETYVDKLDLLGKSRAEFIGRKLKGTERRAHMTLFREMVEAETNTEWRAFFREQFGKECTIPDGLCVACWNCSLFGSLEAGKGATFSRIRYFDTFSIEDATECIQTDDSPEQMAIGNTVGEDLSIERGEASFHRYEYVKAGTRFPFITIIESPTLLDVASYLAGVKLADQHGYGKYSANHGKFATDFFAVSTGYPLFSVLDMLSWLEDGGLTTPQSQLNFEAVVEAPATLFGDSIDALRNELRPAFKGYIEALNTPPEQAEGQGGGRRGRRGA